MTLSRRSALKLGLGAGAFQLLGRPELLAADRVDTPPTPSRVPDSGVVKAKPLPLSAVRLTGGPLAHAQQLSARYLLQLEPDRMLAYYRKRAGLEPKAEPYGGWDGDGRNLTGHIAGHYLSGVSLMYVGVAATPIASVALVSEVPRMVTRPIARIKNGNDSQASVSRMISWSKTPR